jgi:methylated-DNA-[protein]-cysteine S-methyltransferase
MSEPLVRATATSPIGKLYILARGNTVLGLNLSGFQQLYSGLNKDELSEKIEVAKKIKGISDSLEDYFDGDIKIINSLSVKQPGGDFSQECWKSMRKVKPGKVASYGELAEMSGSPRAMRAAGSACAKNKIAIIIPCHRIVKTGGAIGNYGWGINKKIWLLRHEGVDY